MISHFVRELERSLPESDRTRLAKYADAVSFTTHHGDLRRAFYCAEWAVHLAEKRSDSHVGHLVEGLRERLTIWRDSLFGAHFGFAVVDGVGPGEDVEIQWVEAAVAVASAEAERSGWEAVPWEDLLKKLLTRGSPEPVADDAAESPEARGLTM